MLTHSDHLLPGDIEVHGLSELDRVSFSRRRRRRTKTKQKQKTKTKNKKQKTTSFLGNNFVCMGEGTGGSRSEGVGGSVNKVCVEVTGYGLDVWGGRGGVCGAGVGCEWVGE